MDAKFARSGRTSVRGKRGERLEFQTDPETLEIISLLAVRAGMPRSEFINEIITVFAHGQQSIEEAYINRTRMIAGRISGQIRDEL
ncbi:hypothetical protein SAMN05216428_102341 [Nitrosospira sp. Nsp11]|uniref:hypothetical protein n=1 Tax=Nitrosospira sp. Nsp11 TaxID=1855338 RepID=UPI000920F9A7|nr:hypothetical protein [Nitrosospira sp. Nsp11]SHL41834.1 hypothetical protein SAMN05216428_102341 [Nitrosospira sp. Nsp11]